MLLGLDELVFVMLKFFVIVYSQINAWRADKDAEALRFHKLLMEEEEAARKRYITIFHLSCQFNWPIICLMLQVWF